VITDIEGVRVGHWTDPSGLTGCTVVVLPPGAVASGEVRGGAPGTREWDLLAPERMVQHVDAVVLSGGSAFGLATADGVMVGLAGQGRGVPTAGGPVPIVVGAVVYDLVVAAGVPRPGAAAGRAAFDAASGGPVRLGRVGAGAGATVDKWRGRDRSRPGGVGSATHRQGSLIVSALMVVNAWGSVVPMGAEPDPGEAAGLRRPEGYDGEARDSTTIGVVATNAALTKPECLLVAQSAHDGLARALWPVHTTGDGDAVVACAVSGADGLAGADADLDVVRMLTVTAVAAAIRSAVA
jgi:L-aminopeptidase/D-esterase-like protein